MDRRSFLGMIAALVSYRLVPEAEVPAWYGRLETTRDDMETLRRAIRRYEAEGSPYGVE